MNRPGPHGRPTARLLLVQEDGALDADVRAAAGRLGAHLDCFADVQRATAWLIAAPRAYTHVLFGAGMGAAEIDVLAGLAAEADRPAVMLCLGCQPAVYPGVHTVSLDGPRAIDAAVTGAVPQAQAPRLNARDLAAAVHGGGLRVRFQPILRCTDLEPIGVEALARLSYAGYGLLRPRDFLPLAIVSGLERLLMAVGASRIAIAIWSGALARDLSIGINMTVDALMHGQSLQRSLEFCGIAGVSPERVVIEALETSALPDLGMLGRSMAAWRRAGFRLAMDDAGPALPHWREMMRLPFNTVKLDGAMTANPAWFGLAAEIVESAKRHGRQVVAEGIEDAAGLARARAIGVDFVQGYRFARPLPAPAVLPWLAHWRTARTLVGLSPGAVKAKDARVAV